MIYTVTGPIAKEELGVTLSHEHLAWDTEKIEELYFDKTYDDERIEKVYKKLLPLFNRLYNIGCRAIAETSPPEGGQNLKLMQKLSKASGIRIIPNTGLIFSHNVYKIHNEYYETELAKRWIQDFEDGLDIIDGIIVRPSHIKIFISEGKLPEVEKKVLKASLLASNSTGMPVHCHILKANTANEVIDYLGEENCNFSKFLWAHAGHDVNLDIIKKAISRGIWLGFDAIQPQNYQKYCTLIKFAMENGYENKILISQDYDFSDEISKHGEDNPCTSIFTDFIPYCEENYIPKEILIGILTKNPANFYNI